MAQTVYDALGKGYAFNRRTDPRIAAQIHSALGNAETIINVGAGAGSYEPNDKLVLAIEPSVTMIAQRPARAAKCLQACAENLPVDDKAYDVAMAILTIHHWHDWRKGLQELRRVSRTQVLLTFDTEGPGFWLTRDYLPELAQIDQRIMPSLGELANVLGEFEQTPVLIPFDCVDGFLGAYWRRPRAYLDPALRQSISTFSQINSGPGLDLLARDLATDKWTEKYSDVLDLQALDIGYRLLRWIQ